MLTVKACSNVKACADVKAFAGCLQGAMVDFKCAGKWATNCTGSFLQIQFTVFTGELDAIWRLRVSISPAVSRTNRDFKILLISETGRKQQEVKLTAHIAKKAHWSGRWPRRKEGMPSRTTGIEPSAQHKVAHLKQTCLLEAVYTTNAGFHANLSRH